MPVWICLLRLTRRKLQKLLVILLITLAVVFYEMKNGFTPTVRDYCSGRSSNYTLSYGKTFAAYVDHQNIGRNSSNGQWYSQTKPFNLHVYSAFYDNRQSLRGESQLAIIAVLDEEGAKQRMWCWAYYKVSADDGATEMGPAVFRALPFPVGAGMKVDKNLELREYVITCPVLDSCVPSSVSVAWGQDPGQQTAFRVPVEVSPSSVKRIGLAICVSAGYGTIGMRQLTEWFEMNSILGVRLVVMYNHSYQGEALRVIRKYSATSFVRGNDIPEGRLSVELRQTNEFMPGHNLRLLHASPVINDCMYRYNGIVENFVVIDLDEIIIPRTHYTLQGLIKSLTNGTSKRTGSLVFRNAYFFLNQPTGDARPVFRNMEGVFSTYLTEFNRLPPSPAEYSVKSIVNAEACVGMHNHYCWSYTPEYLARQRLQLEVDPGIALLHHYKRCHFDTYLDRRGTCASLAKRTVIDSIMKKYASQLTYSLTGRYQQLNMTIQL